MLEIKIKRSQVFHSVTPLVSLEKLAIISLILFAKDESPLDSFV